MNAMQFRQNIKNSKTWSAISGHLLYVLHDLADEDFKFSVLGYIKVADVSLDSGRLLFSSWTRVRRGRNVE